MRQDTTKKVLAGGGLLATLLLCGITGCDTLPANVANPGVINRAIGAILPGNNQNPTGQATNLMGLITMDHPEDDYVATALVNGIATISVSSTAFTPTVNVFLTTPGTTTGTTTGSTGATTTGGGTGVPPGTNYTVTFSNVIGSIGSLPRGVLIGPGIASGSTASPSLATVSFPAVKGTQYGVRVSSVTPVARQASQCPPGFVASSTTTAGTLLTGAIGGSDNGTATTGSNSTSAGGPGSQLFVCSPVPADGSVIVNGQLTPASESAPDPGNQGVAFFQAYTFTAATTHQATLTLTAPFAPELAVYNIMATGGSLVTMPSLGKSNGGNTVTATFTVTAGQSYIVLATTTFLNQTGPFILTFSSGLGTIQPILLGAASAGSRSVKGAMLPQPRTRTHHMTVQLCDNPTSQPWIESITPAAPLSRLWVQADPKEVAALRPQWRIRACRTPVPIG